MAKKLEQGIVEMIQDCYKEGWKTIDIKNFFEAEFQRSIPYRTICNQRSDVKEWHREYNQRPNVKERHREYDRRYHQRPDVKERHREYNREYDREYRQRPDVKEKRREYDREYHQRLDVKETQRERMREYRQRPDVKEKKREYNQRPNVKEKHRKRMREYLQRPEVVLRRKILDKKCTIDYVMAVFDSEELTAEELRMKLTEKYAIHFPNPELLEDRIEKVVEGLRAELGGNAPIIAVEKGRYKLNRESPYWAMCDGFAREAY